MYGIIYKFGAKIQYFFQYLSFLQKNIFSQVQKTDKVMEHNSVKLLIK